MRLNTYKKTDRGQRLGAARHALKASREPMHVTTGDIVRVMRGDDAGKEGKVIKVHHKTGRINVEGINIVKKHRQARSAEETERHHRNGGADQRLERDAARSAVRPADARSRED